MSRVHTNFLLGFFQNPLFLSFFSDFAPPKQNIYIFLLKILQIVCIIVFDYRTRSFL